MRACLLVALLFIASGAMAAPEDCPRYHCDTTDYRNTWADSTEVDSIRLAIHLVRLDNGSLNVSPDSVAVIMDSVNALYGPHGVIWDWTLVVDSSTGLYNASNVIAHLAAIPFSVKPDSYVNLYLKAGGAYSMYAWANDGVPSDNVVILSVYGLTLQGQWQTIAHELGHTGGLIHPIAGTGEYGGHPYGASLGYGACGPCTEDPNITDSVRSIVGDMIESTVGYRTTGGLTDSCTTQDWSYPMAADSANIMDGATLGGYRNILTDEQAYRFRCFYQTMLGGFLK